MTTLAEKIRFAETYVSNKEGVRWSLKKREWVRDQYWLPADGYKLWRHDNQETCDECKSLIGKIIEHPYDNQTRAKSHEHTTDGCLGLSANPILVTVLNLIRQDGKTFNGMAMDLADLGLGRNISIALVAASEDQVKALYEENYAEAIRKNKKLDARFESIGMKLSCHSTNSFLEALPASAKSVTGRTRRRVRIDEARDVPSHVAWALIPAIQAMSGYECPRGHVSIIDADAAVEMLSAPPKKCTACGDRLVPFFGRVIAASSSGVTGDDGDYWFKELIEQCEREPDPMVHVFRSDTPLNPAKAPIVTNGLQRIFGQLDSMRHHVNADLTNAWTRKDQEFVTKAEVDRCINTTLRNLVECQDSCVAFLDTSIKVDKTSLVILASDPDSTEPWQRVYTARVDWWDPKDFQDGIIDENVIEKHVTQIIPLFSSLRMFAVDTRGIQWAQRLVVRLKKHSIRVESWDKSTAHESITGWNELLRRIKSGTISLIDDQAMRKEFRGLSIKNTRGGDGPVKVVDRDRRKSHKDITESLALCCYMAAIESLKKQHGLSETQRTGGVMTTLSALARSKSKPITSGFRSNVY